MKLIIIIFTLSLCAIATATITGNDQETEWTQFKTKFGKKYSNAEEEIHRRNIFINNKQLIESHNKLHDEGKSSFRMGINQFADLSEEEFVGMLKPIPEARTPSRAKLFKGSVNAVPDSIDWRDYNLVTEVKDDRTKCGSVTAYATTGAIEGQHAVATGNLISLSEDNLSYCTFPIGDGCSGGLLAPSDLYNYVIDFDGQDAENCCLAYDNGMCYNETSCKAATILSYNSVPSTDEDALKQACGTFGPIAAGIDGSHITFQLYSGGIYNEPLCSPTQLNHALLVVGYGTEIAQDYWLAKNSWGTSWGIEGYIELSRNNDNQCGIATNANWPTA